MTTTTLDIRLNKETQQRLEQLGRIKDRSSHYLMKAAIERYLDVEEALEAERELTIARWERFELTGETIAHTDVKNWASGLDASA